MLLETQIHTNDEFYAFRDLPENQQKRFELINSSIIQVPSFTTLQGITLARFAYFLMSYVVTHRIGYVVDSNVDFDLAPGMVLQSAVAYISKARLSKTAQRLGIAPDIVVETTLNQEKIAAYSRYGTQLVWVVYPETQVVWVYRPEPDGSLNLRKFTIGDTLDAPHILPGFTLPIADIFVGLELE